MMPSVAFAYGWSEGPWQSRKMMQMLKTKDYALVKDLSSADVIIGHSLGCYLIPERNNAKLIMLIGLPYWPGKSAIKSLLQNIKLNLKMSHGGSESLWWINKLAHNVWYTIVRPSSTYTALTRRRLELLPKAGPNRQVVLIRNSQDTFLHPDFQKLIPQVKSYHCITFKAGQHEDCWLHPQDYVELIKKYG